MADVLILGYGPAGVSAALYCLRGGRTVLMVGKDGGALSKAHAIENYYGLEKPLSGAQLMEVGKKQASDLGATIQEGEITDLYFDGNEFVATSTKGGQFRGKTCIMATGAARKSVAIAGIKNVDGHGVSYFAVCDAFFYRKKKVAVLGAGEYAMHEASELGMAESVTVLCNGAEPTAQFPEHVKVEHRKVKELFGEEKLEGVVYEDGSRENFDGLFVALGSASAIDLARKAGAQFEGSLPVLDKDFMTTVPGLYAAGDCTGGTLQVAVAVSEGALAGLAAVKYLREH